MVTPAVAYPHLALPYLTVPYLTLPLLCLYFALALPSPYLSGCKRAGEGGDFLWRKDGGIGSGSDAEGNEGFGALPDDTPLVMLAAACMCLSFYWNSLHDTHI